jgi:hypothetical protein
LQVESPFNPLVSGFVYFCTLFFKIDLPPRRFVRKKIKEKEIEKYGCSYYD